jgi:hypothetical protein
MAMKINRRRQKALEPKPKKKYKIFNWLNKIIPSLGKVFGEKTPGFEERIPIKYFYYIGWVAILMILYERMGFMSEKYVRDSIRIKNEVEDLRAEFTSIKAEYMKKGKQSEIKGKVEAAGLEENLIPPKKIIVKKETNM